MSSAQAAVFRTRVRRVRLHGGADLRIIVPADPVSSAAVAELPGAVTDMLAGFREDGERVVGYALVAWSDKGVSRTR